MRYLWSLSFPPQENSRTPDPARRTLSLGKRVPLLMKAVKLIGSTTFLLLQICKIPCKETFCVAKIHGIYHRKETIKEIIISEITDPSFLKNCMKLN